MLALVAALSVVLPAQPAPATPAQPPAADDPAAAVAFAAPAAAETADAVPFTGTEELWCTMQNPGANNFCINAGHHSYPALDVGMATGDTVRAAGPGTVIDLNTTCPSTSSGSSPDMSCSSGRGRFVAIAHADGRVSRYLHLSSVSVAMNQVVSRGQVIGAAGNSGSASAPHLHYDEQKPYGTLVDPGPMVALVNGVTKTYPNDLGYTSWWVTPYGTLLRNDGYSKPVPFGDFSGDGTGDPAVYDTRTGAWQVLGSTLATLGGPGQVPVPGDYSGAGPSVPATYQSATGTWRVQGAGNVVLGGPGQVPVPGDFDGDGATERAVYVTATGQWKVEGAANVTLGGPGQVPVPGDYDGDGVDERATYEPRTGIWRVEGAADTTFGGAGQIAVPADYTGDGLVERATYAPDTGAWRVQGVSDVVLGGPGEVPVPADFSGDGVVERATYVPSGGLWRIEGVGTVGLGGPAKVPVTGPLPWITWSVATKATASSDVDADARGDAGAWRASSGQWLRFAQSPVTFGADGDVALLGDLDGDGVADRTVFRPSLGIWFTQASGFLPFVVASVQPTDEPVLADTDGDGVDEPMIFRPATGRLIRIGGATEPIGTAGDVAVWGDRDGDGRDEVGVFRPSTGEWRFPGESPVAFGQQGDVPLLVDVDGDLRDDRVLYRPDAGVWFIGIDGWWPVAFGQPGDVPVAVDTDGDLRADLGVFRPATGEYLAFGAGVVAIGQAGDVPVPRSSGAAPVPAAAPSGVTAQPGDGAAVVSWSPPAANGGSPVIGYRVEAQPGGVTADVPAGATATTLAGLTNGVQYDITVEARTVAGLGDASAPAARVVPALSATVPGAPTGVTALPSNQSATVLWTPPSAVGGGPITGYTVTASPGGAHVDVGAGQTAAVVDGLSNGTTYTFTVRAVNAFGPGAPSAASNAVTPPGAGGGMHPLTPSRLLDTRDGAGPFGAGEARALDVTGVGGVPADGVSAVMLNVTITGPTAPTHLTVWPTGQTMPTASSLNATSGQTVANLVLATVGAGGKVSIFNNSGSAHVVVDVVGWVDRDLSGSRYTSLSPARIVDSRDGTGGPATPFGAAEARDLQVTGVGGVPASGVTAVVVNVTVTAPTDATHLTVWPAGQAMPTASNLNAPAGATVPNLVVAAVGAGGKVSIFNNAGSAHVIVDVVGYYSPGGGLHMGMVPTRIVDTRDGTGGTSGPFGPEETRDLTVAGVGGVPASGVSAVVLNVTVTGPTAASHVTVWPAGQVRPNASNLNVAPGQTVPNMVVARVGPNGKISVFNNSGSLHLIIDVVGYVS